MTASRPPARPILPTALFSYSNQHHVISCCIVTMTAPVPTLPEVLTSNGVDEQISDFLKAKGIVSLRVLALMAVTADMLFERVIAPVVAGVDVAGVSFKTTSDPFVARATVTAAWMQAVALTEPAGPIALTAPATAGGASSSGSSTTAIEAAKYVTMKDSDIKAAGLAPGVWCKQIKAWEDLQSPARKFPVSLLIGAEKVLARILYEHFVSKLYSPIKIGEIPGQRSFSTDGNINKRALEAKEKQLKIRGTAIEFEAESIEDIPKDFVTFMDAMSAIAWAFVFCEVSTEAVATAWCDYWVRHARHRNVERVKKAFETASWKVAMEMRGGTPFEEVTKQIRQDSEYIQELFTFSRERSRSPNRWGRHNKESPVKLTRKGSKGKGKGKGKGQGGKTAVKYCREWNGAGCQYKGTCKFVHACSWCGGNHKATSCKAGW